MTAGTPIESRDPEQPGVLVSLDSLRDGLHFMLGYQPMLDGGYNDFTVTSVDVDRFAGRWGSEIGPTTYRAAGFFCARRRSPGTLDLQRRAAENGGASPIPIHSSPAA